MREPDPDPNSGGGASVPEDPWLQTLLDALGLGIIVCDRSARPILQNRTARGITASGDWLGVRGGRLVGADPIATESLYAAIRAVVGRAHASTAWRGHAADGDSSREVWVHSLRPAKDRVGILLAGSCLELDMAPHSTAFYGFTPAEAALAARMAAGRGVAGAAADLGLERSTVRTRLKSLFAKTGTHSQAQLVSFLLRGLGGHLAAEPGESDRDQPPFSPGTGRRNPPTPRKRTRTSSP